MAEQVEWNGQRLDKWVVLDILKERGFKESRTLDGRQILFRYEGGESRTLSVIRIREWHDVQVDLDSRVEWEATPRSIRARAQQIGDDEDYWSTEEEED